MTIRKTLPASLVAAAFVLGQANFSVLTPATVTPAEAPAAIVMPAATGAGPYGSGVAGSHLSAPKAISAPARFVSAPVWQFGDSIARLDGGDLATRLQATGKQLAVHNWSSRGTKAAVDSAIEHMGKYGAPEVLIMATGTNDIFNPPVMAGEIARLMAATPEATQVLWVNVFATRWALGWNQRESDLRNTGWVNNQILEASYKWENFTVVKWYETLSGNPGYRLTRWLSDGVHTTTMGRNARNSLIVSAVRAASR